MKEKIKMKKTLALILAMLLAASVALVSCDNKEDDLGDDGDDGGFVVDFDDFGETDPPETDENGETIAPSTDKNNQSGNSSGSSTTMETVSDTVYVLYTAKIREEASDKSSVSVIDTAPFGASLTRSAKNSKWSKIKYTKEDNTTVEGYIANDLITTNAKAVNFIPQKTVTGEGENQTEAPVITQVKDATTLKANNIIIRKFPLADGVPNDFKVLDTEEFNNSCILAQIPAGTANVTVVSVSEDGKWAYVKGKGNKPVNGEYPNNPVDVEGYTLYSSLVIAGNSSSSGNSGDAIG